MKHALIMICIALVVGTTGYEPPEGNCKPGEVWRCYMGGCTSTLLACPTYYEDGKLVTGDCNTTSCNWDCSCVKKQKDEEE